MKEADSREETEIRYFLLRCSDPLLGFVDWWRPPCEPPERPWLCVSCGVPRPDAHPQSERRLAEFPDSGPLGGLGGTRALLARMAFLDLVCDGTTQAHFRTTPLLDLDGQPYEDWQIAIGRHRIVVLGTDDVHGLPCEECGTLMFLGVHHTFVLPPPALEIEIFDAGRYQLLVTERVLRRTLTRSWPGLIFQEIEALTEKPEPIED